MTDLKKIYVNIFNAIKSDDELLMLLDIDKDGVEINDFLKKCRSQIIDSPTPDDLLNNYDTRICIYEEQSNRVESVDVGYIRMDIHITQDKDKIDRKKLKIAKRLIEVLDSKERKRAGKKPLPIGLFGLSFRHRTSDKSTNYTGWDKYSLVFEYQHIANLY